MIVKLGEVCEQLRGVSYDKSQVRDDAAVGYIPVLRANNIQETGLRFEDLVYVPKEVVKDRQLLRAGDVVIAASSGSKEVVGKAAQVKEDREASFGAFCKLLRPHKKVDPSYFAHFFNTPDYRRKISALSEGANINNLKNEHLNDLDFPLPPLPEQRRIAAILDKAQALVANDKRTLAVYDQLAKSLFLEMFGDPVRNERGWEVVKLSGCYEGTEATRCGPFGSALKKGEYVDEGVPVWTMDSIVGFSFDPSACLYITPEKYADLTHYAVKDGDIIISRAGTVGKMCVLKSGHAHSIISTNLIKLSLDKSKLLPEVFVRLMTYFRGSVGNLRTGKEGAFTHMNTQVLDNLTIPLPPMVVQKDYMMSVEAIDVQCIRAEQSLRQSEALFGSLLQGAFAGGLGG